MRSLFYSSAFKALFLVPLCIQLVLFYLRGERKSSEVATSTVYILCLHIFEYAIVLLMNTRDDGNTATDLCPRAVKDFVVSHNQRSRVNIIVWGSHTCKELIMLEVCAKFCGYGSGKLR